MLGRITSCLFLFLCLDIFFSTTTIVNNNYNNNHTVKMMMNDDEDRYYSNSSDDDDSNNRPFYHYCTYPYCRRRYTDLRALVQHELSAHTSRARPYPCSYCGQRFSRDVNRDLHEARSCTVRRRNDQAAGGSGIGGAAAAPAQPPVATPPPSIDQQRRAFNVRRTNTAFFGATNTYRILFYARNSPVQFVEILIAGTETMYNKLHGFLVNRGS